MQMYLNIFVELRLPCQKSHSFSCSYHETDTNITSPVLEHCPLFKVDPDQMHDPK